MSIYTNIANHIALKPSEREYLDTKLQLKHIPKKTMLLEQGEVAKKFYYVDQGSLRAFNTNTKGKESTIMFAMKDWWITDMYAFMNQKPALLSIETLEKCTLVELDFTAMESVLEKLPKLERYFRILFQRAYVREQLRVLDNISNDVEQRYFRFVEKYPDVSRKITQKQLASYLGVTPEFLSQIKNK